MMKSSLPLDPYESEIFIYERLRSQEDYAALDDTALIEMVRACQNADARYFDVAKVLDGGYYDDEAAYSMILESLVKQYPAQKTIAAGFVDDYMEYYERFLEKQGLIDWD